jgi:ribosome-associated protein
LRQAKRPRSPSTHTRSAARFAPAVKTAADLASDRKALDIVVLDLGSTPEAASMTDYFLICTGRSDIHVHAICDRVVEGMKHRGRTLLSSEGVERGQWALLDYGDIVVHVFQENVRKHYDLERLWAHAPRWTYREGSDIEERPA